MDLPNYYIEIIVSFIIGIISSLLFDFFRSLRKLRKTKNSVVMIEDIIYFVLVFIIVISAIYLYLEDNIRAYMVITMIISIIIYFKFFSKYLINIYLFILKRIQYILNFVFITFKFHICYIKKITKILHKFVKKCCIKNINMVTYIWNKLNIVPKLKQKKKVKNEK